MSEISSLYSSKQTIYKRTGRNSRKNLHGDVKHIVYKDGKPLVTEIIKVHRDEDEETKKDSRQSKQRRTIKARQPSKPRASSEEVIKRKQKKLSERLTNAVRNSQTLWSEKEGIWISYQGSQGFLVKLFDQSNQMISNEMMTQGQILESEIPGLLDTGWQVI